jgi:hypothetical protein
MSYESDPPRLAEGGDSVELQGLFQDARSDLPSDQTLDRMLARLGPIAGAGAALAGDAVLAGANTASQAATTSTVAGSIAKLVAVVAGAGLIAGGVAVFTSKGDAGEKAAPAVTAPKAPAEVAPPAPVPAPPPAAASDESLPEPAAPAKAGRAESKVETDTVKAEAALLERARSLATHNPRQALAITREHARRFPNGLLAQEREVIAIEALRKLGREDEAGKRASEFRESYPGSAHQHSIGSTPEK